MGQEMTRTSSTKGTAYHVIGGKPKSDAKLMAWELFKDHGPDAIYRILRKNGHSAGLECVRIWYQEYRAEKLPPPRSRDGFDVFADFLAGRLRRIWLPGNSYWTLDGHPCTIQQAREAAIASGWKPERANIVVG
jgi:hypothetical protein